MEPTTNPSHLNTTLDTASVKNKSASEHVYQWATVAAALLLLLTATV